jgi:hypothetical protein
MNCSGSELLEFLIRNSRTQEIIQGELVQKAPRKEAFLTSPLSMSFETQAENSEAQQSKDACPGTTGR